MTTRAMSGPVSVTPAAVGVVVYRNVADASAIDEYSRNLVRALTDAGAAACYDDAGLRTVLARVESPAWILLQYNPFSYGRWGFAPGLVRDAVRVKQRWPHAPFVLTVHEAWVPITDWRSALMSLYQRAQLRSLLTVVDRVIVVRARLERELRRNCAHVPVSSNITPTTVRAAAARAQLGLGETFVVALFGTNHPSRALGYAEEAVAALAAVRGPGAVCVLNLGRDAPSLALPPGVRARNPGGLPAEVVSLHLRASDILLLPFTDGLSTRRTTLMAGLAHGLPVAGLRGFNTDSVLVENSHAVLLTDYGDLGAFARGVVDLCEDSASLLRMGSAGRHMYEAYFDWPTVAALTIAELFAEC